MFFKFFVFVRKVLLLFHHPKEFPNLLPTPKHFCKNLPPNCSYNDVEGTLYKKNFGEQAKWTYDICKENICCLEDIEWEISAYFEFGDTQRTDHCKRTGKDHKGMMAKTLRQSEVLKRTNLTYPIIFERLRTHMKRKAPINVVEF